MKRAEIEKSWEIIEASMKLAHISESAARDWRLEGDHANAAIAEKRAIECRVAAKKFFTGLMELANI